MDLWVSEIVSDWDLADSVAYPVVWVVTQLGGRGTILVVLAVLVGYLAWRRRTWLPLVRVLVALRPADRRGLRRSSTAPAGRRRRSPVPSSSMPDGASFPSGHVANAVLMWGVARWQAVEYGLPAPRPARLLAAARRRAGGDRRRDGVPGLPLGHRRSRGCRRGRVAVGRGSHTGCSGSVTLGACPSRPAVRVAACGDGCWRRGPPSAQPSSSVPARPPPPRRPPSPAPAAALPAPAARSPTRASRSCRGWSPSGTRCWRSTTAGTRWPSICSTPPARSSTCTPPRSTPTTPRTWPSAPTAPSGSPTRATTTCNRPTVALLALRTDGTTGVYRLTYPDGPHDAEALLLAPDGTPYLVTKEVLGASKVYRPASALVDGGTVALVEVAGVNLTLTGTPGGPGGPGRPADDHGGSGVRPTARTWPSGPTPTPTCGRSPGPTSPVLSRPPRSGSRCRSRRRARRSASRRTTSSSLVASEGLPSDLTVVPLPRPSRPQPHRHWATSRA